MTKITFNVKMSVDDLREWIKEQKLEGVRQYQMLCKKPELLKLSGFKAPVDVLDDTLNDIEKCIQKWEKANG